MTFASQVLSALLAIGSDMKTALANSGGGAMVRVFTAIPEDDNNVWSETGGTKKVGWNSSVADPAIIDSHEDGDVKTIFKVAGRAWVFGSIFIIGSTVNNRTIYLPLFKHYAADGSLKDMFPFPSFYVRDDLDSYDDGGSSVPIQINVSAGDYIEVEVYMLGEGNTNQNQPVDQTYSMLKIDFNAA